MSTDPAARFPIAPAPAGGRAWLRRSLRLVAVGALVFATCGPSVIAEESSADFFRADRERLQQQRARSVVQQRPTHLIRRAAPVKGFTVEVPEPGAGVEPVSPATPETTTADAPPALTIPPPDALPDTPVAPVTAEKPVQRPVETNYAVAVIGDSLGQMLGQGLVEAYVDHPEVAIQRKARENTGLVRDDYFDWVKGARDLLAGPEKFNAAVIMIGSNDRQQLRDGAGVYDNRTPRWRQMYGDRVEAIAQAFKDRKIPLIWVGLPIMKGERFSSDMELMNEIFRERAGKAGALYVDTWDAFLDDRGQYAAYGPDVNGQFQKLRAADGVHFTRPGARKLAHFVETEIKRLMDDARPQVDPAVVTLDPQSTREPPPLVAAPAPLTPPVKPADLLAALPAPVPVGEVFIPVKPVSGSVAPLTGPVLAPGGELATRARRVNATSEAEVLLDRTLVQGRPLEPRPGRADDFSWPRR